MAFGIGIVI